MTIFRYSWIVALLWVGGCNRQDSSLCSTLMFDLVPQNPKEDAERCIAQQSWILWEGGSNERDTATAVMGACRDRINSALQAIPSVGDDTRDVVRRAVEADLREYALFMVVRARAGNCRASPETLTGGLNTAAQTEAARAEWRNQQTGNEH